MRRLAAILLLLSVAGLGSGALRHVHELTHAVANARAHAGHGHDLDAVHGHEHDHHGGDPAGTEGPGPAPVHDPADCFIHAQLNLPMHDAGYAPALVCVGRLVAFPAPRAAPAVRSRRPVLLLDSRGPPAGAIASSKSFHGVTG